MISRIYIDNFRCFTNFEYEPDHLQLVLGDNGTGKTSVFDLLDILREFVTRGMAAVDAFPSVALTAWDRRLQQTLELSILGNGGRYDYRLRIDHERSGKRCRIGEESVEFDQIPLYRFDGQEAHLFRDDGSTGSVFPFDWSRSAVPTIPERPEHSRLTWFRNRLERVYIFSPEPARMSGFSEQDVEKPDRRLHQVASWLRHLSQEALDTMPSLREALQEVMPGLVAFRLEKTSDRSRELKFEFGFSNESGGVHGRRFSLPFSALSDGQRALVALFTILHAAVQPDSSLLIDEADNYIALREVQPWLTALQDRAYELESQVILISHHPEAINVLAANHGCLFFREDGGPVRTRPFEWKDGGLATPAEIIAHGWE